MDVLQQPRPHDATYPVTVYGDGLNGEFRSGVVTGSGVVDVGFHYCCVGFERFGFGEQFVANRCAWCGFT